MKSIHLPRNALILSLVLPLPNTNSHMTLDTDACIVQISFILQQLLAEQRNAQILVSTPTDAQCKYDTVQRECHAVVSAGLLLRLYLKIIRHTICIDYKSLKWILNLTSSTEIFAR